MSAVHRAGQLCHWEPYGDGMFQSGCTAEIVSDSEPETLGWTYCPGCGYELADLDTEDSDV